MRFTREFISQLSSQIESAPQLSSANRGSSGSTVRFVDVIGFGPVAVKECTNPRVDARTQAARRASIEPYFRHRLPAVLFAGKIRDRDVLVTEAPSRLTFAQIVNREGARPGLFSAWESIVNDLQRVWIESATAPFSADKSVRNHHARCHRARADLGRFLDRFTDPSAPIQALQVVDGVAIRPVDLMHRLEAIPHPSFGVACHGDPQPTNILLDEQNEWHLIDWEWSGTHHDWRLMMSHLCGWWITQLVGEARSASAWSQAGTLFLRAAPVDRGAIHAWLRPVQHVFNDMSSRYGSEQDDDAVRAYVALLLLRALPGAGETRGVALLTACIRLLHRQEELWR